MNGTTLAIESLLYVRQDDKILFWKERDVTERPCGVHCDLVNEFIALILAALSDLWYSDLRRT
jgi:hypothetical protein